MQKPKLYVTREIFEDILKKLEQYYEIEVWDKYYPPPYDILLEKAKQADALLTMLTDRIDANLLQQAKIQRKYFG